MSDALDRWARQLGVGDRVAEAILDVAGSIPQSTELALSSPDARANALVRQACTKAATISGGAALVPGPAGLLTLLPDLIGVWRVQAQLVADIAAVYGRSATLGREQMLYCLFRHLVSQGLRDLVVRAGERYLVRRASLQVLQKVAAMIGLRLSQQTLGKAVARYVPLAGATGVAAYAWLDTRKVGAAALELFSKEVEVLSPEP